MSVKKWIVRVLCCVMLAGLCIGSAGAENVEYGTGPSFLNGEGKFQDTTADRAVSNLGLDLEEKYRFQIIGIENGQVFHPSDVTFGSYDRADFMITTLPAEKLAPGAHPVYMIEAFRPCKTVVDVYSGGTMILDLKISISDSVFAFPPMPDEEDAPAAAAADQIILTLGSKNMSIGEKVVENDVVPLVRNGRTMLPVRAVAEAMGAQVGWNGDTRCATITKGDLYIEIYLGSDRAYVNGTPRLLDAPAFAENNRTYLPLRFVAESLGAQVDWEQATQRITITMQ